MIVGVVISLMLLLSIMVFVVFLSLLLVKQIHMQYVTARRISIVSNGIQLYL